MRISRIRARDVQGTSDVDVCSRTCVAPPFLRQAQGRLRRLSSGPPPAEPEARMPQTNFHPVAAARNVTISGCFKIRVLELQDDKSRPLRSIAPRGLHRG